MLRIIFAVFLALGTTHGQVPFLGFCPDAYTVHNLDLDRYIGKWYEVERYFASFEPDGKCVIANYSRNDDGTINIFKEFVSTLTGVGRNIELTARVVNPHGKLEVVYKPAGHLLPQREPYWVLDTDYDTYTVVWSCSSYGLFNTQYLFVMTRERFPPGAVLDKAHRVIEKNNIDRGHLFRVNQHDCPGWYH